MKTKIISLVLCACALVTLLSACGSKESNVRDDVPTADIAAAIGAAAGLTEGMMEAPDTYVSVNMEPEMGVTIADLSDDYTVFMNVTSVNINEYGVFKAKDADSAATLKTALDAYLKYRDESWMHTYLPEEYPKLENAVTTAAGNYVIYTILGETEAAAAKSAFEEALKK
jgi:3D (Asp-Asp-Asp) domain-containing protein